MTGKLLKLGAANPAQVTQSLWPYHYRLKDLCSSIKANYVVGIHHSGGNLLEPDSNRRYLRNAGSSMIVVLQDLQ